jgi:hypothetical protein
MRDAVRRRIRRRGVVAISVFAVVAFVTQQAYEALALEVVGP